MFGKVKSLEKSRTQMQLFLIRHAQSTNNAIWEQTLLYKDRVPDPPLTELGRRQAEVLAHFLATHGNPHATDGSDPQNIGGFAITHLYCSLMERAVATGEILCRSLGLPLVAWPEIHEGGGLFYQDTESSERTGVEGPGREYFETHHPELALPQNFASRGWWHRPHEKLPELLTRARRVQERLLQQHGDTTHRVALITHGGFYHFFLSQLIDVAMPEERTHWFHLNNAGISHISFEEHSIRVNYLNRVDFLPADLIT